MTTLKWNTTVSSSRVAAVAHDGKDLHVRFVGGAGAHYVYFKVPEPLYRALITATSVGGALQQLIINAGYAYERVAD